MAAEQAGRNFAPSKNAFIKSSYTDASGKTNPMYYLNRDGFMFVTMGFTGDKATEIKWKFIQAFNAMEQKLIQLMAERKSAEWLEVRKLSKCQQMTMIIIKGLLAKGYCYKQIYLDAKQKINDYAQLSLFNQRFITA